MSSEVIVLANMSIEVMTLCNYLWSVPSQFVLKSVRTKVNSYSFWSICTQHFGQFVLIWSIRTHVVVNLYSTFWSFRTHLVVNLYSFGQFVSFLVNSNSYSNEYELTKMSKN